MTAADHELTAMLARLDAARAELPGPADQDDGGTGWSRVDVAGLLRSYADGVVGPGEVVASCLARIRRVDPDLGAIRTLDAAGALAAAELSTARWRAGRARPLEGVPIVIKDLLDTAQLVTSGGSRWLAGRVPDADAAVVGAVRRAGAIVLGKAATFELGCGDEHGPFGTVRNPWDPRCTTGGSSSGSAASLAAGYAPLALGTDTGGSIRIPAAYCGVVGLKPTLGRLSCDGLLGLAPTLDTPGPMARTVSDVARLFAVLVDGAVAGGSRRSLAGTRIGVARTWFCDVLADDVAAAFEKAVGTLTELGGSVVALDLPHGQHGATLSWVITMVEAARTYAGAPRDQLSEAFRGRLEIGDRISAEDYDDALRIRRDLTAAVVDALADCDVAVMPSTVSTAPPLDQLDRPVAGVAVNWPDVTARTMGIWNVTGLPALSVPIGFGTDGLPAAMQVVARPFADETCLAVGDAYQSATFHHTVGPDEDRWTSSRGT